MAGPEKSPGRLGLIVPFAGLALVIVAWSMGWLYVAQRLTTEMDRRAEQLARAGLTLQWADRQVSGYPFRLNLNLTDVRMSEPSGWAARVPRLKAEAAVYSPLHWVLVVPDGLTLTRPQGGPLAIRARLLRASLVARRGAVPRIAVEGRDLAFQPAAGARPFWLHKVRGLDLGLQPGPDNQQALLMRIQGGEARLGGVVARIVENQPLDLDWQSSLDQASHLKGGSWPDAVRAWSQAGGRLTVRRAQLTSQRARLTLAGPPLRVGADGRLEGELKADLGEVSAAVARAGAGASLPAQAAPAALNATLTLRDGAVYLGPLVIAAAPRLF